MNCPKVMSARILSLLTYQGCRLPTILDLNSWKVACVFGDQLSVLSEWAPFMIAVIGNNAAALFCEVVFYCLPY